LYVFDFLGRTCRLWYIRMDKNTHAPSLSSAHLLMGPTCHQLFPFPPQSTSSVRASRVHRRRHAPCSAPAVVTARPDPARASLLPPFNPRLDDVAGVEAGEARAVADAVELLRAPAAQPCIPLPVPSQAGAARPRAAQTPRQPPEPSVAANCPDPKVSCVTSISSCSAPPAEPDCTIRSP